MRCEARVGCRGRHQAPRGAGAAPCFHTLAKEYCFKEVAVYGAVSLMLFQWHTTEQGHHPRSHKGVVWDLGVVCFLGPHPQIKQGQVPV